VWSAREIGPNGEHGRELRVNRNYATPVGGGQMHPVNLYHRMPILSATDEGIVGMEGIPVYAASSIGSRIMPGWNAQRITPEGEVGPLIPTPRRFARPISNGALRPYKSLFGRRIGPQGTEGPLVPLGGLWQDLVDMPLAQKVAVGVCFAAMIYLAAAPLPKYERNPKRKFLGMSSRGERLWGELNPEDIRYYHVFAVKDGKERYVGQVLDTGGAYFGVLPSGKQISAHTAKQAAESLVGG
jgi:hypothetical protein